MFVPSSDEQELEHWFFENISTDKKQVFKKFEMTISVMQDADSIQRVAYEAVEDLVEDGVVYGELRYAPLQHLLEKLSPQEVVDAVSTGIKDGEKDFGGEFHTILCAMRQHQNSTEVAELAIKNFNNKVIGFDLVLFFYLQNLYLGQLSFVVISTYQLHNQHLLYKMKV